MTLKERKFTVELSEKEIYELYEALDQRLEALDEASKDGGVITKRHLDTTRELHGMVAFLKRECEHGFNC